MRKLLFAATVMLLATLSAQAADPVRVFLSGGNDVLTKRSQTNETIIDAGAGADVIVVGGGNGQNVEVNAGNDSDKDKIYNESLVITQGDGSIIPYVGGHKTQGGVEAGYHIYHLGLNDEARITTVDPSVARDSPDQHMMPQHVRGIFVIHGPGNSALPTIIKSFDWHSQQLAMASDDDTTNGIHVTSAIGTLSGTDFKVQSLRIVGTSKNPNSNGQNVLMDFNYLNKGQELHVKVPANSSAAQLASAVEAFLKSNRTLIAH